MLFAGCANKAAKPGVALFGFESGMPRHGVLEARDHCRKLDLADGVAAQHFTGEPGGCGEEEVGRLQQFDGGQQIGEMEGYLAPEADLGEGAVDEVLLPRLGLDRDVLRA